MTFQQGIFDLYQTTVESNVFADSSEVNDKFKIFIPSVMLPIFLMDFFPSLFLVGQHVFNYKQEFTQKFYVRILMMIPLNCIVSYFQLFMEYRYVVILQMFRDFYEVYVIITFYYLLLCSSGEFDCLTRCVAHLIPRSSRLCCCTIPVPSMKTLLLITRISVYQFVIQKPILSILKVVLVNLGLLQGGPLKVLLRLYGLGSMFIALWVLLFFFRVISKAVVAVRPVQIFLWIKVAMFLNILQEFIIGLIISKNSKVLQLLQNFTSLNLRAIDYENRVAGILFLIEMLYLNCVSPLVFPLKSKSVIKIKEVCLYLDKKEEGQERTYWGNVLYALKDILTFWNMSGMGCPHGISIDNYSNQLFEN